jgi:hypothetical protein
MTTSSFFKIGLISLFITLNLLTVVTLNCPAPLESFLSQWTNQHTPDSFQNQARLVLYRLRQYANLTGLDPRWEMFSNVKGPDWRYQIEGVCNHGAWILPLPGQSQRTLAEEWFFDFKEGKFRLNTAASQTGRHAYVQYLCKKFEHHLNHKIHSVRLNIQYQDILDPSKAQQVKHHYADPIQSYPLEIIQCR